MKRNIQEIPEEVRWHWAVCMGAIDSGVGMDTMKKLRAIEEKYPKYFPWEAKYRAIPKEVHDAYYKEITDNLFSELYSFGEGCDGVLATARKMQTPFSIDKKMSFGDLEKVFSDYQEKQEEGKRQAEAAHKKAKALWDKHYSKYKLPYK